MSTESTLWMGDIEPWMTEEIIMKSFIGLGIKPLSIKMIKDRKLNISKNYCFVNFDNMIEANKAITTLNGKKLPNADFNFKLNWANQNSDGIRNLYVGNLSKDIDDIELYTLFKSRYPSVHHASIITDQGFSKGYGFVHFSEKEDYDKCLREMNGYVFHNHVLKVKERIQKCEDKGDIEEKVKKKKKLQKNISKMKREISVINSNSNNSNSSSKLNVNKKRKTTNNKKTIEVNTNDINNCYNSINNNYIINNQELNINNINNNIIINQINPIASFYPKKKVDETSRTDNDGSTFASQDRDQDSSLVSSYSIIINNNNNNKCNYQNKKRKFSYNIELLESNDRRALDKKIQESVDKLYEHCKGFINKNESKYILYN